MNTNNDGLGRRRFLRGMGLAVGLPALEAFRPECRYDDQAKETMRFLISPPVPLAVKGPYSLMAVAAIGLLPRWAQHMLRLPVPPGVEPLAIRPTVTVMARAAGWFMSGPRDGDVADRMLIEA